MSKVKISYGFTALLCVAYYLLDYKVILAFLLSVAVHETAHYIAIRSFGAKIESLSLNATGAVMEITGTLSYKADIVCALTGPFASLVLGTVGAGYGGGIFLNLLTGISLAHGIFNLVPILPLDGGRALQSAIEQWYSPSAADAVMFALSIGFAFILAVIGIAFYISGMGGITLIFLAVWLIIGTITGSLAS